MYMSAIGFCFNGWGYLLIKTIKYNSPVTTIIKNKEIIISLKFVNFDKCFYEK